MLSRVPSGTPIIPVTVTNTEFLTSEMRIFAGMNGINYCYNVGNPSVEQRRLNTWGHNEFISKDIELSWKLKTTQI